ncbi:MAG: X-X-X-Leu-X-X-Gly heptad repeat protein [Myxococcota bacterium]
MSTRDSDGSSGPGSPAAMPAGRRLAEATVISAGGGVTGGLALAPSLSDGSPSLSDGSPSLSDGSPSLSDGSPSLSDGSPSTTEPNAQPRTQSEAEATRPKHESQRSGSDILATLTAIDGDLKGDAFVLHAGQNHLGRGADCAPVLNSRWISRSHATITCDVGKMTLRASAGKDVHVNEVPATVQLLHDGDLLKLGTTVLVLRTVAPGERPVSSVIPIPKGASGEHKLAAAAHVSAAQGDTGGEQSALPPAAKRKRSIWRFWAKPVPVLVFMRGGRMGESFELTSARIRIGGLEDNEIVITGKEASRNHAELRVRDGRVHIWDLRSINGTWVNEKRIENTELRFGDIIRIGSQELRFED